MAAVLAIGILSAAWLTKTIINNHLNAIAQTEQDSRDLLQNATQLRDRRLRIKKDLAEVNTRIQESVSRIPSTPQETEVLQLLANLAQQFEFEVQEFRPGGITTREQFKEMEISIRGDGSYQSVCYFLAGIDALPRIGRVSQLTIAAPTEATGRCGVTAKLHVAFALDEGKMGLAKVNRP